MPRFSYRHLHYFWHVAREGGVTAAAEVLHVSQPAVSAQVKKLEQALGEELLDRSGRGVELTEVGRVVYEYAEQIFTLGRDLSDAVEGLPGRGPLRLRVGIVDALPKLMAHHLVAPATERFEHLQLTLRTAAPDLLYAELAIHNLDLVLSDSPLPTTADVRAYNHFLGECGLALLGAPDLAARYREGFPGSLAEAPFLLPNDHTMLRRSLGLWFEEVGVEVRVVADIDDSGILKVFAREGMGLFAVPSAVREEVERMYGVETVAELPGVRERFYAISVERRIRNPAVAAIAEAAAEELFVQDPEEREG